MSYISYVHDVAHLLWTIYEHIVGPGQMRAAGNIIFTPYGVQESTQNLTICSSLSAFSFPKISVHAVMYATKCDLLTFLVILRVYARFLMLN